MKISHVTLGILLMVGSIATWQMTQARLMSQNQTTFPMTVVVADTAAPDVASCQDAANTLNGYTGLPNDRATFFSGYSQANGFNITGWTAGITNLSRLDAGTLATLKVDALFGGTGGDLLIGHCSYAEQYLIRWDGTFSYIGSFDPDGQAGQVSPAIDFY